MKKKKLKQTLSEVRGKLTKTETALEKSRAKAKRWKKEAKAQRAAASRSEERVGELRERLDEASSALGPDKDGSTQGAEHADATALDESWTVVQLRAEARARGLEGISKMSKADLLASLD